MDPIDLLLWVVTHARIGFLNLLVSLNEANWHGLLKIEGIKAFNGIIFVSERRV